MPATDDLVLLLDHLRTDAGLAARFQANPRQAVSTYALTGHERDAVVTRDTDDLVALGVVSSVSELPVVLGGSSRGTLLDRVLKFRLELRRLLRLRLNRRPIIRDPRPPFPGPGG